MVSSYITYKEFRFYSCTFLKFGFAENPPLNKGTTPPNNEDEFWLSFRKEAIFLESSHINTTFVFFFFWRARKEAPSTFRREMAELFSFSR